jgi:uncharacterized protein YaaQ
MKLLLVVVQDRGARRLHEALVAAGVGCTALASCSGLLRESSQTLLVPVADEQVEAVVELVRRHARPREQTVLLPAVDLRAFADPASQVETIQVGGAQVFVLALEQVVRV